MIELLEEDEWSSKEVEESVEEIISENRLLSMSTVDEEEPHINTAFYAFDDELNLYILTPPETRHGRNLDQNPSIAIDVHDSHQEWTDNKKGLQIFGEAKKAENVSKALKLYCDRYPEMEDVASNTDQLEELDSEFYVIKPDRVKVFDEARFGTETWIKVRINDK